MKKLFLFIIAMFTFMCVTELKAEEYWLDINFTRDKADFPDAPGAGVYTNAKYGINAFINAFPINTAKLNVNNPEEEFLHAVRMSRSLDQHFTYSPYPNIGTIKVHYFNTNASTDSKVPVLYNSGTQEEPIWSEFDPVVEILVKKNDDASAYSRYIEVPLNINQTTQIRFGPNRGAGSSTPNVLFYAVQISKYTVPNSLQHETVSPKVMLQGRIIRVQDNISSASIFNLSGIEIGRMQNGESFEFQSRGHYIVKIETKEKMHTQKIVVF